MVDRKSSGPARLIGTPADTPPTDDDEGELNSHAKGTLTVPSSVHKPALPTLNRGGLVVVNPIFMLAL